MMQSNKRSFFEANFKVDEEFDNAETICKIKYS